MLDKGVRRHLVAILLTLTVLLQWQRVIAENRMLLKKQSDHSITLELTNSDAIAGFQFSLQGHGGIMWDLYAGSARTEAAGIAICQFLVNDSTLNIVLLAPFRSALPPGQGGIGRIDFKLPAGNTADSVSVVLGGVVICDANAQSLDISAENLVWSTRENAEAEDRIFALEQNYPNPFNPTTTIAYSLQRPGSVRLVVYDVAGRLVNTLVTAYQTKGRYALRWNAVDDRGSKLPSGMYFARLQVDGLTAITKMLHTK